MAKATIKKSSTAPNGKVHFSFANSEFELDGSDSTYDTEDSALISNAQRSPYLEVDVEVPKVDEQRADYDPNDPHDNPEADHLSSLASDASVKAADANEVAVRDTVGVAEHAPPEDNPTVAESEQATFDAIGAGTAQLPESASVSAAPVTKPPTSDTTATASSFDLRGGSGN